MGQASRPRPRARAGEAARANPTPKAGRNLPAATVVGLAMLFAVLGGSCSSAGVRAVTTTFAVFGVWEIFRALEAKRNQAAHRSGHGRARWACRLAAYFGGLESLLFALLASSVAVLLWRTIESAAGSAAASSPASSRWAGCRSSSASRVAAARRRQRDTAGAVARRCDSGRRVADRHDAPAGGFQRHLRLPGRRVLREAPHGAQDQPQEVLGRVRRLHRRCHADRRAGQHLPAG